MQHDSMFTYLIMMKQKGCLKEYYLTYRPINKKIKILQIKTNKSFFPENHILKFDNDTLLVQQIIIGKIFTIINQNVKFLIQIKGYADEFTKKYLSKNKFSNDVGALLLIKPGFMKKLGQIYSLVQKQFQISRFKKILFSKENIQKYIVNQKMQNSQNNDKNIQYLTSCSCFAFQLKGQNVFIRLNKFIGLNNPIEAKKKEPLSLRATYGINIIQNCCFGTKNPNQANTEIQFIFSFQVKQIRPHLQNSSLCLIKPHVILQKNVGQLLNSLLKKNVRIQSMRLNLLSPELILNYMNGYKFLPQYQENVKHFSQGKSIYLQITIPGSKNGVQQFKKICGPYDPTYAKKIDADSIRGKFGVTRVKNAIHCTQLSEDASFQIHLIFQC